MSREYPDRPIFGVGAIIFEGDQVLLVKRKFPPKAGFWSLPGGAQEVGETAIEALKREVMEETWLVVEVVQLATIADIIDEDKAGRVRHHYTVADYVCRVVGGELQAGGDAQAVKWVPVAALDDYKLTPKTRDVIEATWKRLKSI